MTQMALRQRVLKVLDDNQWVAMPSLSDRLELADKIAAALGVGRSAFGIRVAAIRDHWLRTQEHSDPEVLADTLVALMHAIVDNES